MKPQRIQRKRVKGWRMPPNTISVARPGKWGNPFKITWSAQETVEMYTKWLNGELGPMYLAPPSKEEIRRELAGKNLACWCKVGEPCHGDVLLEIANS